MDLQRCEVLEAHLQAAPGLSATPAEGPSSNPASLPIESIGRLMTLLIEQLSAVKLTVLAHACHRQHRHHLALGRRDEALRQLHIMAEQQLNTLPVRQLIHRQIEGWQLDPHHQLSALLLIPPTRCWPCNQANSIAACATTSPPFWLRRSCPQPSRRHHDPPGPRPGRGGALQ